MGSGGVPSGGVAIVYGRIGDLPVRGKPNSRVDLYNKSNPNERLQSRWYGTDGRASRNRDYKHGGNNIPFPHDHQWNWEQANARGNKHLMPDYDNYN